MTRLVFMERLRSLLGTLPFSEQQEALRYYEEYFNDAGPENEQHVIEELGSPEQVAQTILNSNASSLTNSSNAPTAQTAPTARKKNRPVDFPGMHSHYLGTSAVWRRDYNSRNPFCCVYRVICSSPRNTGHCCRRYGDVLCRFDHRSSLSLLRLTQWIAADFHGSVLRRHLADRRILVLGTLSICYTRICPFLRETF